MFLRQSKLMHQYADLLLKQFLIPYYQKGSREVHLIFDHPKSVGFNPKCYEHDRWYDQAPKAKMHNRYHLTQTHLFQDLEESTLTAVSIKELLLKH